MKEKTKRTIGNLFASLIKNDRAIEGAKTAPWWIGVILFVLGNFLPVIPIMTNTSKTYGASFMASYTYGYDQGLATTSLDLQAKGYTFTVNDNKQLTAKKGDEVIEKTWVEVAGVIPDEQPISSYVAISHKPNSEEEQSVISFEVYYSDREYNTGTKTIVSLISAIEAREYVSGTTNLYVEVEGVDKPETYTPSYLIVYKNGIYGKIFKTNTTTSAATSYKGNNWKNTPIGTELLSQAVTVGEITPDLCSREYVEGVKNNWSTIFNKAYINQKTVNFWFSSGLYFGIYLVLGAFMGFMIWLLTRGKRNPNRGLTIWTCFGISAWIDLTPGLLGMIVGFIFSQAAGVGYIVLIGIRTMWLSMRQLNPQMEAGR